VALFPGLPGSAGTRKVKPILILLKQETVSGSGISWAVCKSATRSRQITMPAPHHSIFYRPDALTAAQPTASKHWRIVIVRKYKKNSLYATNSHCNINQPPHHFPGNVTEFDSCLGNIMMDRPKVMDKFFRENCLLLTSKFGAYSYCLLWKIRYLLNHCKCFHTVFTIFWYH